MTRKKNQVPSVDDLKVALEEIEGREDSEENEEDSGYEQDFFEIPDYVVWKTDSKEDVSTGEVKPKMVNKDISSSDDSAYYKTYGGDQDIADLEEEYARVILEYFRARRKLSLISNTLQKEYDKAGMSIDLSEVIVGRA